MPLLGVLGNGSKAGYSTSSPMSFTKIGQLMDIPTFISLVATDVDTTVHSPSNIKTSMPGMYDPFEVQISLLSDLDPATSPSHEALEQMRESGTTMWWRFEIPSNRAQTLFKAWEFQGYVKEVTHAVPIADKQITMATIKYAGNLSRYSTPAASVLG